MNNASLRIGKLRVEKFFKNTFINFQTDCTLAVTDGKTPVLVEFIGSSSQVNGLRAAFSEKCSISLQSPEWKRSLIVSEDIVYKNVIEKVEINTSKKPTKLALCLVYPVQNGLDQLYVFSHQPQEVIFQIGKHFCVPTEAHWAGWIYDQLVEQRKISEIDSFGIDAVHFKWDRADLMELISKGIKEKHLGPLEEAPLPTRTWKIRNFQERRKSWQRQALDPNWSKLYTSHLTPVPKEIRNLIGKNNFSVRQLLKWHFTGRWGLVDSLKRGENVKAILDPKAGNQIISAYKIGNQVVRLTSVITQLYGALSIETKFST